MKILENSNQVDLSELYVKFKEKYNNVFIYQINDQCFLYRTIGRKEYKDILSNKESNNFDKEEYICKLCTLYPANFDFENCEEAGIPTELANKIIKNSMISEESRSIVIEHYKAEMWDIDNQISCMIVEAFPYLELEDVENWDMDKTAKYLSRAQWILHNMRGVPYVDNPEQGKQIVTQEIGAEIESSKHQGNIAHNGKEKVRKNSEELENLKRRFPEIDWDNDVVNKEGINGIIKETPINPTPPALRAGWRPGIKTNK